MAGFTIGFGKTTCEPKLSRPVGSSCNAADGGETGYDRSSKPCSNSGLWEGRPQPRTSQPFTETRRHLLRWDELESVGKLQQLQFALPRDNPLTIDFANAEAILIADLDGLHHNPDGVALDPVIPANVNFELRWSGPFTREVSLRDAVNGFRGLFKRNSATLSWSATRAGFQFVSDAANTSTTVFAEVGRESKGIFF